MRFIESAVFSRNSQKACHSIESVVLSAQGGISVNNVLFCEEILKIRIRSQPKAFPQECCFGFKDNQDNNDNRSDI